MTKEDSLMAFLEDAFSADGLFRLLYRIESGRQVINALPRIGVSMQSLSLQTVESLSNHGLITLEFFKAILLERRSRTSEVVNIAILWLKSSDATKLQAFADSISSPRLLLGDFWAQLPGPFTCITIGSQLYGSRFFEASGLIGTGDALALASVLEAYAQLGESRPEIATAETLTEEARGNNLILIGGPDANSMTNDVFFSRHRAQPLPLTLGNPTNHEIAIVDTNDATVFAPRREASPPQATFLLSPRSEGHLLEDFGLITKIVNPYSRNRWVLILSGCFGHGTHAAALGVTRENNLRLLFDNRTIPSGEFQILVRSPVVLRRPAPPSLIRYYSL